ncbi:hypothetical protein NC653_020417 [Populus alba x Populus x berolinensis]|uniref:Uncharacterized protein n=1 Tax=Populus alba x Populus x berolinensis TaxID=444605 RepID=A0AAD6ML51_9ROSI|nr:hypothetical protein NC653_020417 [Populus alba x Populus x berolinensis]
MQKEKAKQGLPLLDFPAKDFLSIPTQSNVTVKTNSLSRSWSGNTPFLSLEMGPQRSDLFTSYFHLAADSRRFSPLPCEKILCGTDL